MSINEAGSVAGYYNLPDGTSGGFVRQADGAFATLESPGAMFTTLSGLNAAGTAVGTSGPSSAPYQGILFTASGIATTFVAPDAGTNLNSGTEDISINLQGATAGFYSDQNYVGHGFLRNAGGVGITEFNAPGAGTVSGSGTFAQSINAADTITGYILDNNSVHYGFLRTSSGGILTFAAPGAGAASSQGTVAVTINSSDVIAGYYIDSSQVAHGFVRTPGGQ
jgi:hypothetical protein